MSHSNLVQMNPYQSTTTVIDSRPWNFEYLLTIPGLIQIVCLMCELISNIYIQVESKEMSGAVVYFFCATIAAFIVTSLLVLSHVIEFNCIYHSLWPIFEITYSVVTSILFLLLSALLLIAYSPKLVVVWVCGIVAACGYGAGAFFEHRKLKPDATSDVA